MNNWAFFNAETGDEITRGWQGYEDKARAHAQAYANGRGVAVEFQPESDFLFHDTDEEDYEVPEGEVVEPEVTQ